MRRERTYHIDILGIMMKILRQSQEHLLFIACLPGIYGGSQRPPAPAGFQPKVLGLVNAHVSKGARNKNSVTDLRQEAQTWADQIPGGKAALIFAGDFNFQFIQFRGTQIGSKGRPIGPEGKWSLRGNEDPVRDSTKREQVLFFVLVGTTTLVRCSG